MNTATTVIPLHKLIPSDLNARTSPLDKQGLAALAENIALVGVLENLVVTKEHSHYGVVAGRRRHAALQLLLKRKRIEKNYPVNCLVVPRDKAIAMSLSENALREAMSPADEFESFFRLHQEGKSIEDIAALFAVTPLVVQRRLKLASVDPLFIDMLRKDEISLDQLMALALTDDHEKQRSIWNGLSKHSRSAYNIREALTGEAICYPSDPIARYVGLEAYEKAGGPTRRDLFRDDEHVFLLDVSLVQRLATDKLEKHASKLMKEGYSWVESRLSFGYSERSKYGTTVMKRQEPSPVQAARIQSLDAKISEINEQLDSDMDDETHDASLDELTRLEDERAEIEETLLVPDPEFQDLVGAIVSVGQNGRAAVTKGLIKPENKKLIDAAKRRPQTAHEDMETDDVERSQFSERITRGLTAHLTCALQATISQSPRLASALLVRHMLGTVLDDVEQSSDMPLVISVRHVNVNDYSPDLPNAKANSQMREQRQYWAANIPKENVFEWLLALSDTDLSALLAFCIASTIDAVTHKTGPNEDTRMLMRAAKLDMAAWWRPTGENYLGGISKSSILDALREAGCTASADALKGSKKDDVIARAEREFAPLTWVPQILRA